jgi:hypothetical protein
MGSQNYVAHKQEAWWVSTELSKELRSLKNNLMLKGKTKGNTSTQVWNRPIRSRIGQEALFKNGINRGKAHGRELNG